jgi:hypothetical protein
MQATHKWHPGPLPVTTLTTWQDTIFRKGSPKKTQRKKASVAVKSQNSSAAKTLLPERETHSPLAQARGHRPADKQLHLRRSSDRTHQHCTSRNTTAGQPQNTRSTTFLQSQEAKTAPPSSKQRQREPPPKPEI